MNDGLIHKGWLWFYAVMIVLFVLLMQLGLPAQVMNPDHTATKVDQLRLRFPETDKEGVKLIGMIRDQNGKWVLTTVHLRSGFTFVTAMGTPPYESEVHLDSAYVVYRTIPPKAPGRCEGTGSGAVAVEPTVLYWCTPDDVGGLSWSWTRFSGGTKTW